MPKLTDDGFTLSCVFPEDLDSGGNFKVPDGVKVIGKMAFDRVATIIRSVTLPFGLISIDSWAFKGCYGLTDIEIPQTVRTISKGAFERCSGLVVIEIYSTYMDYLGDAFSVCGSVKQVVAMQHIQDAVWSQCVRHWDASDYHKDRPLGVLGNKLKKL